MFPISRAPATARAGASQPSLFAPRRAVSALALAGCVALLAGCNRGPDTTGDSPQVAAAKGAIAHRLDTIDKPEFRGIVEYGDGVVCGEFNRRKMFSGVDSGFRKFIYNAPEPGALVIDGGNLPPQDIAYWCSEQPDKRIRMLAASVAELAQACRAAGNKSGDISCRLSQEQKKTLDELQAQAGRKGTPAASAATATAAASAIQPPPAAVASAPVVAAAASAPAPVVAAAAPAPTPAPARADTGAPAASAPRAAASSDPDAAILGEVEVALRTWRQRWQDGDVDGYLRMYEDGFSGDAGSHAKWEQQRRQKMQNARPSIGIEKLQAARITPQEVELRFVQVYAAKQHRDTGSKTLVFRRTPQGWRIADERWVALR